MSSDELLRSVARFQQEMLRKREEQEIQLSAKEPKCLEEKGKHYILEVNCSQCKLQGLFIIFLPSPRGSTHSFKKAR